VRRDSLTLSLPAGVRVQIRGVRTFFGITFACKAVVLTTGTFMNGRIWVGRQSMEVGGKLVVLDGAVAWVGQAGGWVGGQRRQSYRWRG
jgi:hypothetical protein